MAPFCQAHRLVLVEPAVSRAVSLDPRYDQLAAAVNAALGL